MVSPKKKGLSLIVIVLSGFLVAIFVLLIIIVMRHQIYNWSPSSKNINKLIKRKKYADALNLVKRSEKRVGTNSSILVEKGKIWMGIAWEKQNRIGWRTYGKNENDWMDSPESSKAVACFKDAIINDRDNRDAHYYLAIVYMDKGWYSFAETEFMEALKADPNDNAVRMHLGVLYSRMRKFKLAEQELYKAYEVDSLNPKIAKNLATLFRFYTKQPSLAMIWANRYLNLLPKGDSDIGEIKSDLLEMINRYPEYVLEEPMSWVQEKRFTDGRKIGAWFK